MISISLQERTTELARIYRVAARPRVCLEPGSGKGSVDVDVSCTQKYTHMYVILCVYIYILYLYNSLSIYIIIYIYDCIYIYMSYCSWLVILGIIHHHWSTSITNKYHQFWFIVINYHLVGG